MPARNRTWELVFAALLALHFAALAAHHGLGLAYAHKAVFLFHFDFERNLPTLFSVALLLRAAWCSWRGAGVPGPTRPWADRRAWSALAAIFLFLAVDEGLSIHEALIAPVGQWLQGGALGDSLAGSPWLTFAWILPYGILVAVLAVALSGWLRRLPSPTRRGFLLSAALYLTGALALEATGAWWVDGDLAQRDLGYDLLVTVEESLEMIGLLVFAAVARRYVATHAD